MGGGTVLQQGGKNATLRFSLEESVWFHKGQEVAELVSLSLEPNVTIQENEQYITIRGSLDMTGEYRKLADETESDIQNYLQPQHKYVHQVDEREEGLCEFFHPLPVDITLPKNRVRSLDELNIHIDTFDYSLPEKSCLKLVADLYITGVYQEQQSREEDSFTQEKEVQESSNEEEYSFWNPMMTDRQEFINESSDEPSLFTFSAQAKKEKNIEEEQENEQIQSEQPVFAETRNEMQEEVLMRHAKDDESLEKKRAESSSSDVKYLEIESEEEVDQEMQEEQEIVEEEISVAEDKDDKNVSVKSKKKKKKGKYEVISLTDFFARKDDSEPAKLKICIVQQGDTLESIAERYEVTQQQILRLNHLEPHQDVSEGQVLYIPVQYSKTR
jgi:stage VI sporulation protein D